VGVEVVKGDATPEPEIPSMQDIIKTGSSGGDMVQQSEENEEEDEDEEYSFNMEELDTESINILVTLMLHCISYE